MNALKQNIIHAIIIAAVISVCLWANPAPKDNVHGILLPSSNAHYPSTNPGQVLVFKAMPAKFKEVGIVRTNLHYNTVSDAIMEKDVKESVEYAKTLAANAGANAIVLTNVGRTQTGGPLDGVMVYAKAILVQTTPAQKI
ncbi:hypothetical protein N8865_01195 [Francisellaceae bacterium]|nr:hypothetical protein [Francisellaceae bacterium]